MKKAVAFILIIALSFGAAVDVHAETFNNFKLSSTSATDYKENGAIDYVVKNGGSKYENCFYFTPTYFSKSGNASFRSVKKGSTTVLTSWVTVSSGSENVGRSKYYNVTSTASSQYKLQGKKGSISSGSSITVSGRWTP